MRREAVNSGKFNARRARLLHVSLISAALLAAAWAAAAVNASRSEGTTTSLAAAACVAPLAGLVAWWPGDGDAKDIYGGHNGAFKGSATFAAGEVGQAFDFSFDDDADVVDYVQVPHSPSLNPPGDLTLDAWVFVLDDQANDATIIGKWGDSGGFANQRAYLLSYLTGGRIRFRLSDDAHQNDAVFHVFDTPAGAVPLRTWTHVAAVYERSSGTRAIYVNGSPLLSRVNAPAFDITRSTADLGIGARFAAPDTPAAFFRGHIDEADVFTRALTQTEIQSLYQAGASGKCKDTFAVTNTNDSGPGSLRQAIADAVNDGAINFSPALNGQTITLTSGELSIDKRLTITGPGANLLTVSGNNRSRVFNVGNVVQISGLTISNGRTNNVGAGIYSSAPLTLNDCAVSNNVTIDGNGGGIFSDGGELTVRDSTVSGNQTGAGAFGGGIAVLGGTPKITNSTISGNSAVGEGEGGGIFSSGGALTITAGTVSNNSAGRGGGIRVSGGTVALRGSIVAGNSAGFLGPDLSGAVTSQGFNLVGDNADATVTPATGDQIGTALSPVNPQLGPLRNNGGPTQTHALLAGSPALDAGDDSVTGSPLNLSNDQRGLPRRHGARVDIGAFESQPRTITVTNTNDSNTGSLRQAILDANANAGQLDAIAFQIAGAGLRTIEPLSALPDITDPVVIDGYTQPGASPNTLADGDDAVLLIEISGAGAGVANGLHIAGGGSTVRGLVINRFSGVNFASGNAIFLQGSGNRVEGCFLGTDAAGAADLGNSASGVFANGAVGNLVGGASPAARNVISGNANGLDVVFSDDNQIVSNYIGTARDGVSPLGNSAQGILINASANNTVGGAAAGAGNVISANGAAGVNIVSTATGNRVLGNSIHSNTGLGIDLGNDGVTQNDAGDADAGANNLQNFPTLSSAGVVTRGLNVTGALNGKPNATFIVNLFSNPSCDPSGNGEGQTFLGSVNVTTNNSGDANISAGPFAGVEAGQAVTATATDGAKNTSEFSKCVTAAGAQVVTVTNTNDDGDGSLRQALDDIIGGSINFGPDVSGPIKLARELVVNKKVTINGPGANLVTLSGNNEHRLLNVTAGGDVTAVGLGFANASAGDGGAILNDGALTLTNCNVLVSAATRGGAVFNRGALNVAGSALSQNRAERGGAIYNTGTANVSASTVSSNNASDAGGAVFNTGTLTLTNSTVSSNTALEGATAVHNEGGQLNIDGSTVAFNTSLLPLTGASGGVVNKSGAVTLRSSIVAANNGGPDSDLTNAPGSQGTISSQGFNLLGNISGANIRPPQDQTLRGTDKTNVSDPRLGPLQNNGGPTDTHALLPGSPAIDAGKSAGADQRGVARPFDDSSIPNAANEAGAIVGDGSDIGAFETRSRVSGRIQLAGTSDPLARVALVLSGDSADGLPVTRAAEATPAADADGANFIIMDVPEGSYTVTPRRLQFSFGPESAPVRVPGAQTLLFNGQQVVCPTSTIRGRVTDAQGRAVQGVTLTLSGPKTVVVTTPGAFDCTGGNDPGSFCIGGVPSGGDYTLTPSRDGVTFRAETAAGVSDNTRGGADMPDLGSFCASKDFALDANFDAATGAPTPTPTPSDNFEEGVTNPDRFKTGVLSLSPTSFEFAVKVAQGGGQLQITPRASSTTPQGGAGAASAEGAPAERFNGYVSVRDVDLNSSTSVSVKADQPITDNGAQTVFSFGSDLENFYRIRVGGPSSSLGGAASASQARAVAQRPAASETVAPSIFFEAVTGPGKFQTSGPAEFKKDEDVYWRLRFEPRTTTPPDKCADVDAKSFVLFETSLDRSKWNTRYCAPVGAGRTHVAAELLAGIVGDTTRDPGTAKFSDYRVADRTGIRFAASNHAEVLKSARPVPFRLARGGDVSSAASVLLTVRDDTGASLLTRTAVFSAGDTEADASFDNPVAEDAKGDRLLSLKLSDPSGGALDEETFALNVEDDGFKGNRINTPTFFTEQQYCDFFSRAADAEGLLFWMGQFARCNGDDACMERERVHVSASFFFSIEFRETGLVVYLANKAAYGNVAGKPVPVTLDRFRSESARLAEGVRVKVGDWQGQLERNKVAYFEQFVDSQRFKDAFGRMKSTEYVDALFANAGVTPSAQERSALVLILLTQPETGRAVVLRRVVENAAFSNLEQNRAFVLMQYFGYLQRDPDGAPDSNFDGYNFWLRKLEDFRGDYVAAEMVKAFINSDEYRNRFKGHESPSCNP
jgi:hypothetical protein